MARVKKGCEIWAIGGGKGGTGKSFVTGNIGTYLASRGKRVILIDADIGGANLHTILGVSRPRTSLTDFFERKASLADLIVCCDSSNMGLVTGDLHSIDSGNIRYTQKLRLFRQIRTLETDYILIDLGSGSHANTVDAFLLADKMIIVLVPEITAIENMYHFMKNVLFKKLKISLGSRGFKEFLQDTWRNRTTYGIKNIKELIDYLRKHSTEVREVLDRELSGFRIYLIMNQIRHTSEISIGFSVRSVCMKYFGFKTHYVGYIEYEDLVWRCVNEQRPYLQSYPSSRCAKEIGRIAENLVEGRQIKMTYS